MEDQNYSSKLSSKFFINYYVYSRDFLLNGQKPVNRMCKTTPQLQISKALEYHPEKDYGGM